jgi:predicted  nucleic acid-binding Zn-ribbon protein
MQKNIVKQVEALKEETNKSLKETQGNTIKQVKKLKKAVRELKMEVETLKESQMDTTLEFENVGKRSGATGVSITNKIQEIQEGISGVKDTKENTKYKITPNLKYPGNLRHKTTPKNNRNRREQRFPAQRTRGHLQ